MCVLLDSASSVYSVLLTHFSADWNKLAVPWASWLGSQTNSPTDFTAQGVTEKYTLPRPVIPESTKMLSSYFSLFYASHIDNLSMTTPRQLFKYADAVVTSQYICETECFLICSNKLFHLHDLFSLKYAAKVCVGFLKQLSPSSPSFINTGSFIRIDQKVSSCAKKLKDHFFI